MPRRIRGSAARGERPSRSEHTSITRMLLFLTRASLSVRTVSAASTQAWRCGGRSNGNFISTLNSAKEIYTKLLRVSIRDGLRAGSDPPQALSGRSAPGTTPAPARPARARGVASPRDVILGNDESPARTPAAGPPGGRPALAGRRARRDRGDRGRDP